MKKLPYIFILALIGCNAITGEEIARLSINQITTSKESMTIKETTPIDLKKGDEIAVWSDMDIEYEGTIDLRFQVELLIEGKNYGMFEVDPLDKNITIGEVKTTLLNKTNWSFSGRNTKITIEKDGKYTFKGILIASDNPSLVINKAEVYFKK